MNPRNQTNAMNQNKRILVTGAAGFIGFHLSKRLLEDGHTLIGIDNLNNYYDPKLKKSRLSILLKYPNFTFHNINIANRKKMEQLFTHFGSNKLTAHRSPLTAAFDYVIHLAAQPGVRYSLTHPFSYIDSNIVGFTNILEGCRHSKVKHLVFASSSSIYGVNAKVPFSVCDNVDHPVSLYAASKKANELMAHTYAHLYSLPCTGLRFFTVYGPWGRPDMAYFSFTKAIMEEKPIDVFNFGNMKRDFTYIDDIIEGIVRVIDKIPKPNPHWDRRDPDPGSSYAPYKLYNIGNNNPIELMRLIEVLETNLGKNARKNMLPMQLGDVPITYADVDDLNRDIGFKPVTSIAEGIKKFIEWFSGYYKLR
jgi:UDP-glucuronate 4-epimerase